MNHMVQQWAYDTSVWYQSLMRDDATCALERYYKSWPREPQLEVPWDLKGGTVEFVTARMRDDGILTYSLRLSEMLATPANLLASQQSVPGLAVALAERLVDFHAHMPAPNRKGFNMARLERFLEAPTDCPAGHLLVRLSGHLGDLKMWVDVLQSGATPCHGAWGLGSVFVGDQGGAQVPVGPEVTLGIPELDLGWMLGDLAEMEHLALRMGQPGNHFAAFGIRLVDSYCDAARHKLNNAALAAAMAVRIVLHYCDFAETYPTLDHPEENIHFLGWVADRAKDMYANV